MSFSSLSVSTVRFGFLVCFLVCSCTEATVGERIGGPIGGSVQGPSAQCSDGFDNDGDGLVDANDPGCISPDDDDETNQNGAVCSDGIDNDGDGLFDYPNDPGCFFAGGGSENDSCPNGTDCPLCGNGKDDDGDGRIDFPADSGCDSASDNSEAAQVTNECGINIAITPLELGETVDGSLSKANQSRLISPQCGGSGAEAVYQFELPGARQFEASTDYSQTAVDTVVYLRSTCKDSQTEVICSDDAGDSSSGAISIDRLEAGTYYLVVDAFRATDEGAFRLSTSLTVPAGEPCEVGEAPCQGDLTCRLANSAATQTTCLGPACGDGVDNDGDGRVDFPDDPGCTSLNGADESDSCPTGDDCPVCSNGEDDDGDGDTDYPADDSCTSASGDSELACKDEEDPILTVTSGESTGTTEGASSDTQGSCGGGGQGEKLHVLQVKSELESLRIDTVGSELDTVLYVRGPDTCDTNEVECNDDGDGAPDNNSILDLGETSPGTYYIFVDGYKNEGDYVLNVRGTIKKNQPCDEAAITTGMFECAEGTSCTAGVCKE